MERGKLQSAIRLLFPPQCVSCGEPVETDFGLCGECWRDTPFITAPFCDLCGTPLLGEDDGKAALCDDCLNVARPWRHGRSALIYKDNARRMVLALKHGDRLDLARPASGWLARAGSELFEPDSLIIPIPAHWTRLLRRRYNQAAVLANALAHESGLQCAPDALIRSRRTEVHEGKSREARFANMDGAIRPHPKRGKLLAGRAILLIDDVMTSGATFAAATEACHIADAKKVCVLTLARVAKDT